MVAVVRYGLARDDIDSMLEASRKKGFGDIHKIASRAFCADTKGSNGDDAGSLLRLVDVLACLQRFRGRSPQEDDADVLSRIEHTTAQAMLHVSLMPIREAKTWTLGLLRLARLFSSDPDRYTFFTVVLCRICRETSSDKGGGELATVSVQVRKNLRRLNVLHLLRAINMGRWPLFKAAVSLRTRERCACALACLGDTLPPTCLYFGCRERRGVRILSIDGGGTRGLGTLELLRAIETACGGHPMHELFDVICGTSTGGILAVALGILKRPLDEVEDMYRTFSSRVFDDAGMMYRGARTVVSGAMYPTEPLKRILLEYVRDGGKHPISEYGLYRRDCWDVGKEDTSVGCCRVFVVASALSTDKPRPFLFRNYRYPPDRSSRYPGHTSPPIWSCLRATTAAPGFFAEHRIGNEFFSDGAMTANNPTGIAIHEASRLFPRRRIDCVVSVGTGKFLTDDESCATRSLGGIVGSVRSAMRMVVDTESVHSLLSDLLGESRLLRGVRNGDDNGNDGIFYVRLNPDIEPVALNERRASVLAELQSRFKSWVESPGDGGRRILAVKGILSREGEWSAPGVARSGGMLYRCSRL